MNNYRMKVLRNTEEIEVRIMQKTKQKIHQPRKVKYNWTYVLVSFAVLALVIIGTRQLLVEPPKSNLSDPGVEEFAFVTKSENVEAIEMSYSSEGVMVFGTVTNKQDIHELMSLLTKLYDQPKGQFNAIANDFQTFYSLTVQEKDYYPTGTIVISEDYLAFKDEYVDISREDLEQITTYFQKTLLPFSTSGTEFKLFGVTLGDDKSGVERLLHGMYTELSQVPDGVLPGESSIETEQMSILFTNDKVSAIALVERDEAYYDALFEEAIEAGYAYELKGTNNQKMLRYFYWPRSGQLLTMNYADGSNNGVRAWLMHADPNFYDVFDAGLVEKIEPE